MAIFSGNNFSAAVGKSGREAEAIFVITASFSFIEALTRLYCALSRAKLSTNSIHTTSLVKSPSIPFDSSRIPTEGLWILTAEY